MDETVSRKDKKALLIAAYTGAQDKKLCEEHLDELELLAETFGIADTIKVPCALRKIDASTYFGKGKIEELARLAKEEQMDLVIVDEEIHPSQQRNLEKIFGISVLDRTEIILGVFEQRAQTREARLQIELAQVKYQIPRLKRLWTHLSRQAGSVGGSGAYLKGEGEKQIELDRRILRRKMEDLQEEIEGVRNHRQTQRQARKKTGVPTFAIVGYTNAGKSTLLNALTEADVFVEDKLFATLDTTTRRYTLSNNQEILFIDTVGFIRKLPHLLVAAFKSTLEEALHADILLHVIDASHPLAEEQASATLTVLKELNASDKPIITVLNKADKPEAQEQINQLRLQYAKCVVISAVQKTGFKEFEDAIIRELQNQRALVTLRISQSEYGKVAEVMREGVIIQQDFEDDDILLKAEIPILLKDKFKNYIVNF